MVSLGLTVAGALWVLLDRKVRAGTLTSGDDTSDVGSAIDLLFPEGIPDPEAWQDAAEFGGRIWNEWLERVGGPAGA